MPGMRGFFGVLAATAGLAGPVICAAQAPMLTARELFVGANAASWPTPVEVEVVNPGPDTKGFLTAGDFRAGLGEQTVVRYPIDLPRGASKRVILYGVYGYSTQVVLRTERGTVTAPLGTQMLGTMVRPMVYIGDDVGGFAFLRPQQNQQDASQVAFCAPEKAPPRVAGYTEVAAVLLGGGAERMPDAAVEALREYVLLGGTLVFLGGPAPLVWQDPRWRGLLPVSNPRVEVVRRWGRLGIPKAERIDSPATIATGDPVASASVRKVNGHMLYAVRAHGRGRVVAFAPDLLSEPLVDWNARRALLLEAVRPGAFESRSNFGRPDAIDAWTGSSLGASAAAAFSPGDPLDAENDPFQIELPSLAFAGWTLFGFFIAVVPVNFLVLRRLRKTEWAWFTSPLIAAAFAGIFLMQARSLYRMGMSTALNGEVFEHAGRPGALFVGRAMMFFPSAGRYDLGLKDVDSVRQTGNEFEYDYYERPRSQATIQSFVDDGAIRAPDVRTRNLAFQALPFVQRLPGERFLSGRAEWTRDGGLVVKLTNVGRYPLKSILLHTSDLELKRYDGADLDPGQSFDLPELPSSSLGAPAREFGVRSNHGPVLFVTAVIEGLRPGPQVGKLLPEASRVALVSAIEVPASGGGR